MKKKPDIILLVMDTARKKSMSLYGYGRETTPNLERFARECVVYDCAVSPSPWTVPSHASVFSGLYPSQHGLHSGNLRRWKRGYDLPGLLRADGYRTAGFSANPLVGDTLGFSDTFDSYERLWQTFQVDGRRGAREHPDVLDSDGAGRPVRRFPAFTKYPADFVKAVMNKLCERLIGGVVQDAAGSTLKGFGRSLGFVGEHAARGREKPYFLFLNVLQPHEIYNPPSEFRARFAPGRAAYPGYSQAYYSGRKRFSPEDFETLSRLYDGEIAFMDACIGRWLDGLKALPGYDDTMVVIMSDHGEHFGEHGHMSHEFSLYQELVEVPLMVKYPKGVAAPGREARLVQSHDVFATVLEAAGIRQPSGSSGSSGSLLSPWRESAVSQLIDVRMWVDGLKTFNPRFDPEAFPYRTWQFAYYRRMGGRLVKLIEHGGERCELYDLGRDPSESRDISGTVTPDTIEILRAEASSEMEMLEFGRWTGGAAGGALGLDGATVEQLKGLGYF